jgi:NADPH2:quinone reductase
MRCVVCHQFGPLDGLRVENKPDPVAGSGEVLVDVRAAGVTFVDALLAQGGYQLKPPLPFTPGGEVAGVVAAVGEGVSAPAVGERVLVSCGLGGFTDRLTVPAAMARRLPPALSFGQGAALVQSYATALFALTRRTTVSAGDWMLVLGAGGGVGLAMVDVARHLGARVIAAASSDEKLAAAQAAGAEAGVRYDREDLKARVRELSGGVAFVADPVGGAQAEPALRTLRPFGQYVVLGFAAGAIPALKANLVLLQNRTVVGVDWGAWTFQHPNENAALIDEVLALAAAGAIHPSEPATYPLERAGEALQALVDRRVAGKIVLVT